MNGTAQIVRKFLDIPSLAAKGVSWLTIREWQEKRQMTIDDIDKLNPKERENTIREIFDIYKERLTKLLTNPSEQKHLIEEAMEKIVNFNLELSEKLSK